MIVAIEKASGRAYCRGSCKYGTVIPRNSKCLRVLDIYYCEKCMKTVFDSFTQAITDSEKDVENLKK